MRSKLLSSLIVGSLIFSSSVAVAQTAGSLQPASETGLGSNGESRLDDHDDDDDSEAATAIIFGLVVFAIAVWIGGSDGDDDVGLPISP